MEERFDKATASMLANVSMKTFFAKTRQTYVIIECQMNHQERG